MATSNFSLSRSVNWIVSFKMLIYFTTKQVIASKKRVPTQRVSNSFNSIQDYLYSAFYDTNVANQLYRKLRFYNRFIYCRNLIYLILYTVWGLASSKVLWGVGIISSQVFGHLRSFKINYLVTIQKVCSMCNGGQRVDAVQVQPHSPDLKRRSSVWLK